MTHQQNVPERSIVRPLSIYGLLLSLLLMAAMLGGCDPGQQMIMEEMITEKVTPQKWNKIENLETVKLGLIYTTPRPGQRSIRYGAELAVAQLNKEGGVHGMPIQLIVRDDKDIPERSAAHAEELIAQEGVSAIVGPDFIRHSDPVAAVSQHYGGIPMVTTYPTPPLVTAAGDFVFMAAFTDTFQGQVLAAFATQELEAKSVATLTNQAEEYSKGLSQFFVDNFTALGGEVVARQPYMPEDTDFSEQLTAIAASAPDVIFVPGFVPAVPLIIQQAREMGITATFLGGDGWDDPELVAMGGELLEGSFFSSGFSASGVPDDLGKDVHQFIADYTAMFGIAPDWPASLGYDATRVLVQAMRRADDLSPDAIRDQIAATKGYSGASLIAYYDENRHAHRSVVINRISDGEMRFYQLIEP